jgi:hypothetical protein
VAGDIERECPRPFIAKVLKGAKSADLSSRRSSWGILLYQLADDHEGNRRPQWLELRVPQTWLNGAGMKSGKHQAMQKTVEVQLPLDPLKGSCPCL